MSYEGYVELLCKNGHYWTVDAYGALDDACCHRCGEHFAWNHSVDETNGIVYDDNGLPFSNTVPAELEVDHYEEVMIKIPIFKVPVDWSKI